MAFSEGDKLLGSKMPLLKSMTDSLDMDCRQRKLLVQERNDKLEDSRLSERTKQGTPALLSTRGCSVSNLGYVNVELGYMGIMDLTAYVYGGICKNGLLLRDCIPK